MQDPTQPGAPRSWLKYVILASIAFFLMICLSVGGLFFFIFYKMKDSEAVKIGVQVLRENPAAQEHLGEIRETGWPLGNFSVDAGGTGKADFSMKVKGSKAEAKYYASLERREGVWNYRSGRLQFGDGKSVPIAALSGPIPLGKGEVNSSVSGGKALRRDADTSRWAPLSWPEQPITYSVPPEFQALDLEPRALEYRPEDRMAYFTANLTYFDQKIPFQNLFPSLLQKSAHQLDRGEILGYARKDLGRAMGYLEIQQRKDGQTTAVWTGYYDDEKYGTVSLTLLLGAPTPEAFEKAEPTLGAILESVQVK